MTGAALGLAVLAAASPPAPACHPHLFRRAKPMMATYVSIEAWGCDDAALEEAARAAFAEMQRLAGILSEWDPHSAVSQVNDQAGIAPVAVPPELLHVLEVSQRAAELTGGAFDPTWAALSGLWRFPDSAAGPGAGPPALPDPAEVRRRLPLVDHRQLVLENASSTAFLRRQGMRIGLGGVAKGFIAAAGAEVLVRRGIPDVLVAASGDIAARGRDGAEPWRVAIQDPRHPGRSVATVELHEESISTAGDYEHCFVLEGHRYHHILDPKTGYPTAGTASVSVLSRSGVLADALDTGLLVMGTQAGSGVVSSLSDIGALFVSDAGEVRAAGPLGGRFAIRSQASAVRPDAENQAHVAPLD